MLGTIRDFEFTGEEKVNNRHHPDMFEAKLRIEVDRAILGQAPGRHIIQVDSLWLSWGWFYLLGEDRAPRPGDRVFYIYRTPRPKDQAAWSGGGITPARPEEIERLDRIAAILSTENAAEAARMVLDGCRDADPYFAMWCLRTIDQGERVRRDEFIRAYGTIQNVIPPNTGIEMCWNVMQDATTHSLVYEHADNRLSWETLSKKEQQRRHAYHMRRLERLIYDPPLDEDGKFFSIEEAKYLLGSSYPKMPIEFRIEALKLLAQMAAPEQSVEFRKLAVVFAAPLHSNGNEDSRKAIFKFYSDLRPLREDEQGFARSYRDGLQKAMEKESEQSQQICDEGLVLFQVMVTGGDAELAFRSIQQLDRYIFFCRNKEIDWPDLPNYVTSMIKSSPYERVVGGLTKLADEHNIPLESAPEVL